MTVRRPLALGALLLVSPFAGAGEPDAAVRVRTAPAAGLGDADGLTRLGPSDILRLGGRDHVLYARVPPGAEVPVGRPGPWRAEIWHAVSEDEGHTWRELGPVLRPGPPGAGDAVGVFDPGVLRFTDGTWYLYYSGVGPGFNPRLEREQPVTPVRIFCARLLLDPDSGRLRAERLNGGRAVLEPSPRATREYDSLRVQDPRPLLHGGRVVLVHEGVGFGSELRPPELGVAVADHPAGPFERRLEGRAALPAGGDALIGAHEGGLFALVTGPGRGLWWAEDGEHLARLDARINGRLDDPGLFRGDLEGRLADGDVRWGLHVGAAAPVPYLERFELEVSGELTPPPASRVPTPASTALDDWTRPGWQAQHLALLDVPRGEPVACVLLGDGLVEGFGGHDRLRRPPGEAAWFAPRRAGRVLNLGVTGDHTENVLWRLAHGELHGLQARVVVVAVGSDQLGEDGAAGVLEGLAAIREWIGREAPATEIVLTSVLPRPTDDGVRLAEVARCNAAIERLAADDPGVHHLDLAALLAGPDGRVPLETWTSRGYPGPAAYATWAAELEALLDTLEVLALERAHRRLEELEELPPR